MKRALRRSIGADMVALLMLVGSGAHADIVSVDELGLGGDTPAIIAPNFGEDQLSFSDRTHQHNGAAFDAGTGLLSTTGTLILPLPGYLLGNDYVLFANNARDQAGYSATVTTDAPSFFYLLIDNRIDGPAAALKANDSDPVLGGTLQWVIDGAWQRVDTGISPMAQADYTAVDESGNGVGPGVALNQFYSVWTLPDALTSVTVRNNGIGASNMISLVAAPAAVTGILDIKPGDVPNAINPNSRGVIPVAILGSDTLDVFDIDGTTLAFGPAGAALAHRKGPHFEDVNNDEIIDLLGHYRTQETGIVAGDIEACVTGELFDGTPIQGCDAIVTVPPASSLFSSSPAGSGPSSLRDQR